MILTAADLRRNVDTYSQQRLPVALEVMSRWLAPDPADPASRFKIPPVRTWQRLPNFEEMGERQSPAIVTTTPAIIPGRRDSDGDYVAQGQVRQYAVVRGRDYAETADQVAAYVAAMRLTLLDDPAAVGAADVTWISESYTELPSAADRTIGAGSITVVYGIDVPGPLANLGDLLQPGDRAPTATTTHTAVQLKERT